MFVVLDIFEKKVIDSIDGKETKYIQVYSESSPNSADASRPVALIMGKENTENLANFIPNIQLEIDNLQEDGICIITNSGAINVEFK